ncbi:MAG: hypothetical protein QOI66_3467 [Myxococcales bacterium]|jgi:hypothetical protein|nr:hypothetical protein [Myxococcales bacterium]
MTKTRSVAVAMGSLTLTVIAAHSCSNANHFASMSRTVTVSDGRLTIDQGSAADLATRIDYVEITLP